MTVGSYAGVALQDDADTQRTGAVFLLRRGAKLYDSTPVRLDGWTTTVVGGARAVITCGPSNATEHETAVAESLEAANRGLDYLSATGRAHGVIVDAADDNLTWWSDSSGGVVTRTTIVITMASNMSFTAVVTDSAGNAVRSPPAPAPIEHDVLRFMRMAKTSGDLFDAYRNLFLAFECLLSHIRPQRQGEREVDWFKSALRDADQLVPVAQLAPAGEPDPIEWVYANVYAAQRSGLMHAKQGRRYLVPQDAGGRGVLQHSLDALWRYVRDLIAKHLGVTSGSSHLSSYTWERMTDVAFGGLVLFATDDGAPIDPDAAEHLLDPDSATVDLQPGDSAADAADPSLRLVLASCDPADLRHIDGIRRFGARSVPPTLQVMAYSELTGPLYLGDSVTRFEIAHGIRNVSANGAPRVFSS